MSGSERIGVAIIGCGYWGVNYIRVFNELPNAEVVVICDRRASRLDEIGERFPHIARTTSVDEALAMPGVAAAVICTTATTHYSVTRRCLKAGKHVLVEKPLASIDSDAEKLVLLAESRGLTLMVGHTFLYNAGVHKVKEYVDQESIGEIYYLYSRRTNLGPIRRDVNAIWDLAPHDISIFNYLLNRQPEWVSAVGANLLNNARADVGFITLGYGDRLVGNIHVSWADPNKVRELVVVGSQKRIVFNDLSSQEPVKIYEKGVAPVDMPGATFGESHFNMRDGDIISPHVNFSEPLKNQCHHFLACVENGEQVRTDGQAGLDVVRVMMAIDRSVAQNGAPVRLDAPLPHLNGYHARVEYIKPTA